LAPRGFFGRYELLGEVRQGGMGVVYKARDTALGRVVALKMLKTGPLANEDEVKRFHREAQAVAKLRHPHIVPIYDVGQHDGLHYFTMEYVPGGTVATHLPRLHTDPATAVALVEKVARAVEYAHKNGILHRDLKPANILIDEDHEPRVSDLGLAKLFTADSEIAPPSAACVPATALPESASTPVETVTLASGIVGTPSYMSPEQVSGQKPGRACDIWSLGIVLYELLTGRPPFQGRSREELFEAIRRGNPCPPGKLRPELDSVLEQLCLQCLEKDPAKRPASAGTLADALHRWLQRPNWLARWGQRCRRHPLVSAAAGVLLLAAVGLVLTLAWPDPDRPIRRVQRQLADGETAVLVGENEGPRWFRWALGEAVIKQSSRSAGLFSLDSSTPCLMELLPSVPGRGYRFRAEIRHDHSILGEVGLAFALARRSAVPEADAYYLALTFNDQEARIKRSGGKKCSAVTLSIRRYGESDVSADLEWRYYEPPLGHHGQAPWRQIEAVVTPESIEAFWEGQSIGTISRAEIAAALKRLDGPDAGPTSFPLSEPSFPHQCAAGLFLTGGSACFRRVVVEPIR
jgi:tRNA A-37 threonylcarbamoyl transferase component Bud32